MSKPKKEDIDITHDILYTSQSYNLRTPFIITNHSQHTYVFKVRIVKFRWKPIKNKPYICPKLMALLPPRAPPLFLSKSSTNLMKNSIWSYKFHTELPAKNKSSQMWVKCSTSIQVNY